MCGRFTLTTTPEELAAAFAARVLDNLRPRWNVAPTQSSLVICASCDEGRNAGAGAAPAGHVKEGNDGASAWARSLAWGLPSSFKGRSLIINARMETAAQRPTFTEAFSNRRCIVPACGWYEWSQPRKPWHVSAADGRVMGFGGLLLRHEGTDRFVIMTGPASGGLAGIHHRQPLVVAPQDHEAWLSGSAQDAQGLCRSAPPERFKWHRVGPEVGKVSSDGAELIRPIESPEERDGQDGRDNALDSQGNLFG